MRLILCVLLVSSATAWSDDLWRPNDGTSVVLSDGVSMPKLAFGANVWDADTCKTATAAALTAGFRFIWSSALIGDGCQAAQGAAITASGLARSALFIAGTVNTGSCSGHDDCYSSTKSDAQQQFTRLNVTTLDMLMLDYPSSGGCDGIKGQWQAFTELHKAGKVRTIAVSNFDDGDLQCVTGPGMTKPTVNQLSYSVGVSSDIIAANAKYVRRRSLLYRSRRWLPPSLPRW